MALFLDTGFFLGLLHPKDPNHATSIRLFRTMSTGKWGLIYSSLLVIGEAATIILIRTQNNTDLLQDFFSLIHGEDHFIRLLPWSPELEKETWQVFLQHNKNAKAKNEYLSFVDASSIYYCRMFKIDSILAFDGDFDAYLQRIH